MAEVPHEGAREILEQETTHKPKRKVRGFCRCCLVVAAIAAALVLAEHRQAAGAAAAAVATANSGRGCASIEVFLVAPTAIAAAAFTRWVAADAAAPFQQLLPLRLL